MGTFVAAWALRRLVALCALNFAAAQPSSPFRGLFLHNLRAFYLESWLESWRVEMTLLPLEERENALPRDVLLKRGVQILAARGCERIGY